MVPVVRTLEKEYVFLSVSKYTTSQSTVNKRNELNLDSTYLKKSVSVLILK